MNGFIHYNPISEAAWNGLLKFDPAMQCLTSGNDCAPQVEFLGWEMSLPNSAYTDYDQEKFGDFLIVYTNQQYAVPGNNPALCFAVVKTLQKALNEGGLSDAEQALMDAHFLC